MPLEPLAVTYEPSTSQLAPKKRRRITQKGVAIMENYFNNVNQNPSASEARDLARQIQEQPENADLGYDHKKVQHWFGVARQRSRKVKEASVASTSASVVRDTTSPSNDTSNSRSNATLVDTDNVSFRNVNTTDDLPQSTLDALADLFSEQHDPSEKAMTTWARILSVDVRAVQAWVRNQQKPERLGLNTTHLPTPSHSISPEPSSPCFIHRHLPKLPKVETTNLPAFLSSYHSVTTVPSAALSSPVLQTPLVDATEDILQHLATAIHPTRDPDDDQMDVDDEAVVPLTAEQFNAQFASYEESIQLFFNELDSGALRKFGWLPDQPPDHP